jgi:hypothetical protein
MALLIPADVNLPPREVQPGNGSNFTFAELYELLGCQLVETRELADGSIMVHDEEGKAANSPQRNERATWLADFATPAQLVAEMLRERGQGKAIAWVGDPITDETTEVDYIAGDVLICTCEEWAQVGSSRAPSAD